MTKQTKMLTGLLAGAAIGAGIALILSDKNNNLKDKFNNWLCDLIDHSKDKMADVTHAVKGAVSKAKTKV